MLTEGGDPDKLGRGTFWEEQIPNCIHQNHIFTNETAFVQTKRKLVDDCDLWCIVSLPGGVFTAAGAGVKTNLLFFTKGREAAEALAALRAGIKP